MISHVRSLSGDYWSGKEIVNDLFEHFLSVKLTQNPQLQDSFGMHRNCLFRELEHNRDVARFWRHVHGLYPEKKEYFASLTNVYALYDSKWLVKRYNKYRFKKEFEGLSKEERNSLKQSFVNERRNAYRFALKTEAQRVNCDPLDVRPKSPVIPLKPGYDPKSTLAALPDEILSKTLRYLDTIDVFRMTLVCRRWKDLVYNNGEELKRAEHAVTTHLITFRDWMDPSKTPSSKAFTRQYYQFGWGLVRWYCEISSKLETLIFDRPVSYPNVAALLKSCPNLKNLQLGDNSAYEGYLPGRFPLRKVHLPNLEVYLCSENSRGEHGQQVMQDILCNVKSLRVLRAPLKHEDLKHIQCFRPTTDVFCNLIALDLTRFSTNVLQILVTIPKLQLRYLSLGGFDSRFDSTEQEYEISTAVCRNAFNHLLSKLSKLEVLETRYIPGITNETIQLLIDLDLNLQFAVLAHSNVRREPNETGLMRPKSADPLEPSLLIEFRDRLLLRNPNLDLSDFHIIVREPEAKDELMAADIGFTIAQTHGLIYKDYVLSGLCHSVMRNRLNINF